VTGSVEMPGEPSKISVTKGFPPILGNNARVLILGSLPSQKSLQTNEYYGNPQNAFWRVMSEICGAGPDKLYEDRVRILIANSIAVWDVLASSVRPGSMDSAIDGNTACANDFQSLMTDQPAIRMVCFNGQAAERLFDKLLSPDARHSMEGINFVTLPSTSPAYAAMCFADKLRQWMVIKAAVAAGQG